jgi:hypothetical protein
MTLRPRLIPANTGHLPPGMPLPQLSKTDVTISVLFAEGRPSSLPSLVAARAPGRLVCTTRGLTTRWRSAAAGAGARAPSLATIDVLESTGRDLRRPVTTLTASSRRDGQRGPMRASVPAIVSFKVMPRRNSNPRWMAGGAKGKRSTGGPGVRSPALPYEVAAAGSTNPQKSPLPSVGPSGRGSRPADSRVAADRASGKAGVA